MALKANFIARKEDEAYLDTVARAITSPMTTGTFESAPANDYHRLDISQVLSIAVTENTPLVHLIGRSEAARAIKHFWFEQYHPQDPQVTFLGELSDPGDELAKVPVKFENVMGKQGKQFKMSDEAQIVARANGLEAVGTDEYARQMHMVLVDLVRDTERAILEARYDDGSTGNPRQYRGLLGGFKAATPTYDGWIGGIETDGILDLANTEVTSANVEGILNKFMLQMYNLQAGPIPNTLFLPPRMLKLIQDAAKSRVQVLMTQDELNRRSAMNLGGKVGIFYTDFGFVDIYAHPLLTLASSSTDTTYLPASSVMLFLHIPAIRMIDYVGWGGVHIEPRAKTGPSDTRLVSQITTLEFRQLKSHGAIKNFWVAAN